MSTAEIILMTIAGLSTGGLALYLRKGSKTLDRILREELPSKS